MNDHKPINCYFSNQLNLTFRGNYSQGGKIYNCFAWQCYHYLNYFGRNDLFNGHFKGCSDQPEIVYDLNTQNLVSFEGNINYKSNIPLTTYIDFETTAPPSLCLDPEDRKMFAVSYNVIFAFHPHLNIKRVVIERSFSHSLDKLISLDYLPREQITYIGKSTLLKLKDCAIAVGKRREKVTISSIFSTALKFASDCLLKWFSNKCKVNNLELSNEMKIQYETSNPINWCMSRCFICDFPLLINMHGFVVSEDKMLYMDFYIRKEHIFLRNIFAKNELNKSTKLKDLKTCYDAFKFFLSVTTKLQNAIKKYMTFDSVNNETYLDEFISNYCDDVSDFDEMKSEISKVVIKNVKIKVSKFSLQIYAFLYSKRMDFPHSNFEFDLLTTCIFFSKYLQTSKS